MIKALAVLLCLTALAGCETDDDLGNAVRNNSSVALVDPAPPSGIITEGTPGQAAREVAALRRYGRGQVYDLVPAEAFFPGKGASEAPK